MTQRFAIDWSTRPEWQQIVAIRFKREVERICGVKTPASPRGGFQDDPRADLDKPIYRAREAAK